jgi:hypothetical protein
MNKKKGVLQNKKRHAETEGKAAKREQQGEE